MVHLEDLGNHFHVSVLLRFILELQPDSRRRWPKLDLLPIFDIQELSEVSLWLQLVFEMILVREEALFHTPEIILVLRHQPKQLV